MTNLSLLLIMKGIDRVSNIFLLKIALASIWKLKEQTTSKFLEK